eukprot:scaffold7849_cov457-Prasinococcus_capsulatus_cf.AAC.4
MANAATFACSPSATAGAHTTRPGPAVSTCRQPARGAQYDVHARALGQTCAPCGPRDAPGGRSVRAPALGARLNARPPGSALGRPAGGARRCTRRAHSLMARPWPRRERDRRRRQHPRLSRRGRAAG